MISREEEHPLQREEDGAPLGCDNKYERSVAIAAWAKHTYYVCAGKRPKNRTFLNGAIYWAGLQEYNNDVASALSPQGSGSCFPLNGVFTKNPIHLKGPSQFQSLTG